MPIYAVFRLRVQQPEALFFRLFFRCTDRAIEVDICSDMPSVDVHEPLIKAIAPADPAFLKKS